MTFPESTPFIRKQQITSEVNRVAGRTYRYLCEVTNIPKGIALALSAEAANAFGHALLRDLPENGVEVKEP